MLLFLVSVTVMFVAVLIIYVATRAGQRAWTSAGLPPGVWVSTAIIVGLSVAMRRAKHHVERNAPSRARRDLELALLAAVAFLGVQVANGLVVHRDDAASHPLFAATFYILTGLHALHVLGGLVPLAVITARTKRGEYSSSRAEPVRLVALYWDFMAVIWGVLLLALWLGT